MTLEEMGSAIRSAERFLDSSWDVTKPHLLAADDLVKRCIQLKKEYKDASSCDIFQTLTDFVRELP